MQLAVPRNLQFRAILNSAQRISAQEFPHKEFCKGFARVVIRLVSNLPHLDNCILIKKLAEVSCRRMRIPLTDLGPRGSRISGLGSCGLRSLQISNLEPCQSRSLRLADAPNPRIEFGRGYAPAHPRKECRGVFGLACRHCNKVPVSPETQAIFAANPDSCEIL